MIFVTTDNTILSDPYPERRLIIWTNTRVKFSWDKLSHQAGFELGFSKSELLYIRPKPRLNINQTFNFFFLGKCDQELEWDIRWGRLLDEILSLNCHVLCLQEVDCEHFESHYVPQLGRHGFTGIYKKRTNDKNDGCAIFYKEDQVSTVTIWKPDT